jgi:small-conductance mechanosensitive channel
MDFQPVLDSLTKIITDILNFIPRLINGLIILIVGYLICLIVRAILRFIFRRVRLAQLADKSGVTNALRGLGITTPIPEILAQVVFFFLLISFATAAVTLMGLAAVAELLENLLRFIPRAISAGILLVFGSMLARFLGNTIAALAGNTNITYGGALGKIIEYAIVAFTAVLAISTLGVDTTILTTSFTIIVAAAGLAIALTFGLGSRDAARNVLAGYYVRQTFRPGQEVTVGEHTGRITTIAGAFTTLEVTDADNTTRQITIPNTLLMQQAATIVTKTNS